MQYSTLGNTEVKVSKICLGTMTFGEQNTEQEAHSQLDFAFEHGVNFIDTAEMYPVPPRAATQGLTEAFIGSWLKRHPDREKLVIATKVAGPGESMDYLRGGPQLTRQHIEQALHDSLNRLHTDYVDLYQVHWPARTTNYFGQLGYSYTTDRNTTPIKETLEVLMRLVDQGKVRYIGVSNETPWGVMQYLALADEKGWPRVVTIQNPYSLLNRSYEIGLAEISHRERIGLLAYSPLGFGVLSGKYAGGIKPEGARLSLFQQFTRYSKPLGLRATERYVAVAHEHDLNPAQMALAYVNSRPFITSTIIGATSLAQLMENIASVNLHLSDEVLEAIEAVHQAQPNPCP